MQLNNDAGALRATNNKGLQPAMDFILEHNDDPIPDATSGAAATSSAQPTSGPIVIDEEEDEDTAALHAAYGLKPGDVSQTDSGAGVEARVSSPSFFPFDAVNSHYRARASNVQSAGRYSKLQRSPTSTRRRVGTISSRSPRRRCVFSLDYKECTSTYDTFKIKPLTEEEKRQKLAELRDKMADKRARKAAEEAKEAKANELIRRKAGKVRTEHIPSFQMTTTDKTHPIAQEAAQIKEDLKNKEILKDLEAKRRGSSSRTHSHHLSLPSPTDAIIFSHVPFF